MAGITMSPQLRESPDTANVQLPAEGFCAARGAARTKAIHSFVMKDTVYQARAISGTGYTTSKYISTLCSLSPSEQDHFALHLAGDYCFALADVHVDFVAHAEIRQVNAGFDGEAGEGADAPHVVVLEIIHVGAVAVHFDADGVAGTMGEVLAESGLPDDTAGGVVHLISA